MYFELNSATGLHQLFPGKQQIAPHIYAACVLALALICYTYPFLAQDFFVRCHAANERVLGTKESMPRKAPADFVA
jgi:hypothetical protein